MRFIDLCNLTASYSARDHKKKVVVIKDFNLKILKGEAVAFRGASGSGKSTLLSMVGGMLRPDSGNVVYGNNDIYEMDDISLSRFRGKTMGFLFQLDYLLSNYTIQENVELALYYAGLSRNDKAKAVEALDAVKLSGRRHHLPDELSGGERHRAALARAIAHRPDVLIADEPTGNLDRGNAAVIVELLLAERARGATVLVATHDDWIAAQMDRSVLL